MQSLLIRKILVAWLLIASMLGGSADAGPLRKALKNGAKARSAQVARKALPKAEMMAMAGGLGAGAIYIEASGGHVLFEAIDKSAGLLSGSADDFARLASEAGSQLKTARKFALSRESVEELGERLDPLLKSGHVFVVDPVAGPLKLVSRVSEGARYTFKQLRPGIVTPIDSELTREVMEALEYAAKSERISVLSMFAETDVDSLRALASSAGDRLLDDGARSHILKAGALDQLRGKTVVAVGHVEDGRFVARRANGSIAYSVDIDSLEKMAEAADVTLVSAGCSSFCFGGKIGFPGAVTDMAMADSLRDALEATSLGDMLGAFGKQQPLVVSEESLQRFASMRRLELAQDARFTKEVTAGSVGVRMLSPLRKPLIDQATRDGLLGMWMLGALATLCMFRTSRDAFLKRFPVLPSPTIPAARIRYAILRVCREAVFFVLSPFFMAIVAFTWFVGGWPYRRQLSGFLWTVFSLPFMALRALYLRLSPAAPKDLQS